VVNFLIIAFAIFLLLRNGQSLAPEARAGPRANHQGLPAVLDAIPSPQKSAAIARPLFRFSFLLLVLV